MTDSQEEWLDRNTFYCPFVRSRLTPSRCNDNRKKHTKEEIDRSIVNGVTLEMKAPSCSSCSDWKARQQRVGMSREDEEKHRESENIPKKKKTY